MKYKTKNLILNIIISVTFVLVLGQSFLVAVAGIMSGESEIFNLEVSAESDYNIVKKTKMLDLISQNNDFVPQEIVEINDKESFVSSFNNYFEGLVSTGGYELFSNMVVSGTANIEIGKITAYQAASMYIRIDENKHLYGESLTCEIASPSGTMTGQGENSARKIWDDGVTKRSETSNDVACVYENNQYNLSSNFTNPQEEITASDGVLLVPFLIDNDTISNINIEENTLSYKITLQLNSKGYEQIAKNSKEQANAIGMPEFSKFEVCVVMDKWGNVVALSTHQRFTITVKRGIEIPTETISSGNYIIKKIKKEN